MTDRVIDLAETPARISVCLDQLVIDPADGPSVSVPLEDLAVLVVSHSQVSYTQAVLCGLVKVGAAFVVCDPRHLPVGMLLPIDAHYVQAERFALQARASLPLRKRLWQQIVRAKVAAQARLLACLYGDDCGLSALAPRVRSGDPDNIEAQASRRYWRALFADSAFRRRREGEDQNSHLNYAYAVVRAVVARAICATGLHPSLALHHHNRYDSFCLADDLMEPLRPLADRAVCDLLRTQEQGIPPLDREAKAALLASLVGHVMLEGQQRTLFDACKRMADSLVAVFSRERRSLILPEV